MCEQIYGLRWKNIAPLTPKKLNGWSLKAIYIVNNANFCWWSKWLKIQVYTNKMKTILSNFTWRLLILFSFSKSNWQWGGFICGQQCYRIFMVISKPLTQHIYGRTSINSCHLECVTIDHMDFMSISNFKILFGNFITNICS